jgi:hypothetical protein
MNTIISFSPSNQYELHMFQSEEMTKVKLYSVITKELCGKFKYPVKDLPFCFFIKDGKEYLVSGRSNFDYIVVHFSTGHYYQHSQHKEHSEPQKELEYKWLKINQLDQQTFYVYSQLGSNLFYHFFDFSSFSVCKPLEIIYENFKFDLELDLPEPIVKENCIVFCIKEKRIHGVGKRKTDFDVQDLDLSITEYEKQEQKEDGYVIFLSEEKEYEIDLLKVKMIRSGDHMEILEFWMDKKFEKDQKREQQQKELEKNSIRYQKLKPILEKLKFRKIQYNSIESGDKICHIHLMPLDTKSYHYHLSFSYLDDSQPLSIEFHNLKRLNIYNNKIIYWTEEYTLDFISD